MHDDRAATTTVLRDQVVFTVLPQWLPQACRLHLIVTLARMLREHRDLVKRHWTQPRTPPYRWPIPAPEPRQLVPRLASENPTWS